MDSAKSDLRGDPVGGTASSDGTRDPQSSSSSSDPATLRGQCAQYLESRIVLKAVGSLLTSLLALVDEQAQRIAFYASTAQELREALDASLRAQESQQKERQNDKDSRVTHTQYLSKPLATAAENEQGPPAHLVSFAVEISGWSPCRSKRGSVIFSGDNIVAHGHNHKPQGFECDGSEACKATCRIEAVHAEQRALLAAGPNARGAEMLHVKSVGGELVASGGPSCVQCSKLALVSGIEAMWLFHEDGWRRYDTADWHRQSLAFIREPKGAEVIHLSARHEEEK